MWLVFILGALVGALVLAWLADAVPPEVSLGFAALVTVVGLYILFTRDSSNDPEGGAG
jgi:uncharacterized membrane protein YfcA